MRTILHLIYGLRWAGWKHATKQKNRICSHTHHDRAVSHHIIITAASIDTFLQSTSTHQPWSTTRILSVLLTSTTSLYRSWMATKQIRFLSSSRLASIPHLIGFANGSFRIIHGLTIRCWGESHKVLWCDVNITRELPTFMHSTHQ